MARIAIMAAALAAGVALAVPAHAEGATSARELQSAVDGYLAGQTADASLVGGAGSAGYDRGFWIRGGDFDLKINLTIQARFEAIDFDTTEATPGRDLSGFSTPRTTVKLSGHAPCNTSYYVELEFGHFGRDASEFNPNDVPVFKAGGPPDFSFRNLGPTQYGASPADYQSRNYDFAREAWIEWAASDAFKFRMGQIATPTTRQLMTSPELQQFVDVSLASAFTGHLMSGYTDRNRDHGFMVHGALGCNNEWSWMVAVTNGDGGDSIRNVIDERTDDNLALSARLNWAFLKPTYYEEGALRQSTCEWYGEIGGWVYSYADRTDGPHTLWGDTLNFGADLALGYGGFSMTGAFTLGSVTDIPGEADIDTTAYLVQLGYLFPGTAWEIAARYSSVNVEQGAFTGDLTEIAGAINYYLNGHGNKLSVDVTMLDETDADLNFFDVYTGIQPLPGIEDSAILIRFQWQLAL